MNKKYVVYIQTLNQLKQEFSDVKTEYFNIATDATYNFYNKCMEAVENGFLPIFKQNDENEYMEEHFSNGVITVMIILDLCGDVDNT